MSIKYKDGQFTRIERVVATRVTRVSFREARDILLWNKDGCPIALSKMPLPHLLRALKMISDWDSSSSLNDHCVGSWKEFLTKEQRYRDLTSNVDSLLAQANKLQCKIYQLLD